MSASPEACDECLGRASLVASLSDRIERVVADAPRRRPGELLALPDEELAAAVARPNLAGEADVSAGPESIRSCLARTGVWGCCRHDPAYPPALAGEAQAPAVLFGVGSATLLAELGERTCVTIVGSRRPSAYGREVAEALAREIALAGVIVVSGMALGIDSCAHRGALEVDSGTVAVLGGGPELATPARMAALHRELTARALVVSELPPGTRPRRWTFPARNRIMAALGAMTVVVEARERSGSLITAAMAAEIGREVGAVPGQVGSSAAAGANALLRDGAHVIRSAQDVLDSLLGPGAAALPVPAEAELPAELRAVLELVDAGAATADAVGRASGMEPGAIAAALARLEILGHLATDAAGRYRRTQVRAAGGSI